MLIKTVIRHLNVRAMELVSALTVERMISLTAADCEDTFVKDTKIYMRVMVHILLCYENACLLFFLRIFGNFILSQKINPWPLPINDLLDVQTCISTFMKSNLLTAKSM